LRGGPAPADPGGTARRRGDHYRQLGPHRTCNRGDYLRDARGPRGACDRVAPGRVSAMAGHTIRRLTTAAAGGAGRSGDRAVQGSDSGRYRIWLISPDGPARGLFCDLADVHAVRVIGPASSAACTVAMTPVLWGRLPGDEARCRPVRPWPRRRAVRLS